MIGTFGHRPFREELPAPGEAGELDIKASLISWVSLTATEKAEVGSCYAGELQRPRLTHPSHGLPPLISLPRTSFLDRPSSSLGALGYRCSHVQEGSQRRSHGDNLWTAVGTTRGHRSRRFLKRTSQVGDGNPAGLNGIGGS